MHCPMCWNMLDGMANPTMINQCELISIHLIDCVCMYNTSSIHTKCIIHQTHFKCKYMHKKKHISNIDVLFSRPVFTVCAHVSVCLFVCRGLSMCVLAFVHRLQCVQVFPLMKGLSPSWFLWHVPLGSLSCSLSS